MLLGKPQKNKLNVSAIKALPPPELCPPLKLFFVAALTIFLLLVCQSLSVGRVPGVTKGTG